MIWRVAKKSYEWADFKWMFVGGIKMDKDYIYCQDYMIPREGEKMEQMPKNVRLQDLTPNGKSRLHRISRKNNKDIMIAIRKMVFM